MKSYESFVAPASDYYVHLPSRIARDMFFYPLYTGHFIYEPGYSLFRESYNSFLLLYVESGSLSIEYSEYSASGTESRKKATAKSGDFVLLDCYEPHAYLAPRGAQVLWCHFDGPLARNYYDSVVLRLGNVFSLINPLPVVSKLNDIYCSFSNSQAIREALLSKHLNDILTAFLLYSPTHARALPDTSMSEKIIAYIGEHFSEDLSLDQLAALAGLSQYHFIRVFRKETGFTPHEYIIHIRLNTAKYLLKNTALPIKDICFNTGFSCESVFCSAFKKQFEMTPLEYRSIENSI